MVDAETKRRVAKDWMSENVPDIGDSIAQKFVDKYVDEDTELLLEAIPNPQEMSIPYAPEHTGSKIGHTITDYEEHDPIAPLNDFDLLYARYHGFQRQYIIDPDEAQFEKLQKEDNWSLIYASEEGEVEHVAHNI